jgi:hypothetical protein
MASWIAPRLPSARFEKLDIGQEELGRSATMPDSDAELKSLLSNRTLGAFHGDLCHRCLISHDAGEELAAIGTANS